MPSDWEAYAGGTRLGGEPGAQLAPVARVLRHPRYDPDSADFDLALLELAAPLALGPRVQPVCLPAAPHRFPPGAACLVSGWGYLREGLCKLRAGADGTDRREMGDREAWGRLGGHSLLLGKGER